MLANRKGWFIMKCLNKVLTIIGCITAAVAVVTAAFAVLNYFKEKKENAELEAYLEGSISSIGHFWSSFSSNTMS